MPSKLPPNFNAAAYGSANPDVGLTRLSPRRHFLRFGKLLGRSPNGRVNGPTTPSSGEAAGEDEGFVPIIDRPPGFDPSEATPAPAAAERTGASQGCTPEILARGPFSSDEEARQLCRPLVAYSRMFSLAPSAELQPIESFGILGADILRSGAARIDSAFIRDGSILRLMIGSNAEFASRASKSVLRAYQGEPSKPGNLMPVGSGVQIPPAGPVFHDVRLIHPLMPLLLELSDEEGITRDLALIPFPSLFPGGIHAAELTALQNDANPMDAFWSLSQILVSELLVGGDASGRSITSLSIGGDAQPQRPSAVSPDVERWLEAVFGVSVRRGGRAPTEEDSNDRGVELVLPGDCVPAISALVSRRLDAGGGARVPGPFLVADPDSLRPRWAVGISRLTEAAPTIPLLVGHGGQSSSDTMRPVPIHLAVALRSGETQRNSLPAPAALGTTGDRSTASDAPALSVVLDAVDPRRTEAVVRDLLEVFEQSRLEFIVRLGGAEADLSEALDRCCGDGSWRRIDAGLDPREVARDAQHDLLISISDRIILHDRSAVSRLCDLVRDDPAVGSASCVLVKEIISKAGAEWRTATGGLFPARVSFVNAPRLTFFEPDVRDALPVLTYPVVANSLLFCVWNRRAVAELPRLSGSSLPTTAAIRLGLDLLEAGYLNLCTTRVSAGLYGSHVGHEATDPFGSAYSEPARWGDIFDRVTVLRELS